MPELRVVMRFNENVVEQPITYHLIADYSVQVNILRASIDPGKQGVMVVALSGTADQIEKGLAYLNQVGVQVDPLTKEIQHVQERCTSCTSCVPHCPTDALAVDRETWMVSFDPDKCIVCLSCLDTCIYRAMAMASG